MGKYWCSVVQLGLGKVFVKLEEKFAVAANKRMREILMMLSETRHSALSD